ncbi:uncharacterized protein LOC115481737 [Microcaecilia unicolor]|uniref:RING-type E3 ubiquitin transferase n=1 Tax=Microcaecilia unicolor TaxID=1415580 RepID=A0A6P7ZQA1_9AMPH|nr:uncharacterized protein LOC115481737 [Microcaecilia unicolor]XP_030076946.1 uncharacterized protein LOC115481737 [Microcaecilia unicolor]XP_030076948.1 uncharacterized protein LOC115481737 [Microcaecilia unicolor]XP_030076949.1 uncharacterized protein LOC115481737 [Microcaecilia unicolor]
METRTVRVEGLPTEIALERLKDKLTIYFLRSRNGGGEIENVDVVQELPAYALVTFEETDVAQRVLQMKGHILSVSGKSYPLKVTSPSTELSPDEIFSRVSMIVDYRRFPDSIKHSMKSLREIHKDIQFSIDQTEELFTVNGKYTKIQAFSHDVMKMLGIENKNLKELVLPQRNIEMDDESKFRVIRNSEEVSCPLPESKTRNQKSKAEKQNQRFEAEKGNPRSKCETQNLRILEVNGLKAKYGNFQHEQDAQQLEDFSLVMDSDIYMYIQKFHQAEFQKILFKHEVEVVDVSSNGITTLYLQAGFETGNHIGSLTKALYDLLHLYQRFEASLRKEQISKIDLKYDSRSLQRVPKEIQKLCPSLLCLEDDGCFYLIGNVIDLSQAKQYIQDLMPPKDMGKLVKPSELLLSQNSGTHQRTTSSGSSKEHETDKKSSPTKSELKGEHKLAANFSHPKAEVSLLKTAFLADKDSMRPSSIWSKEGDNQKTRETLLSTQLNEEHPIRDAETVVFPGPDTGENGQKDPPVTDRMKGDISPKTSETSPSFSLDRCTNNLQSTGTRKSLGPMKPYSHDSALQYLSLYNTQGTSNILDSEHSKPKITLRRSNSFSAGRLKEANPSCPEANVKEHSKVVKDTEILDEMCLYTWLWSFMKQMSNITELCNGSGIQIDEETTQDITILKIRTDNKTKLDLIKQYLQSLYQSLSTELTYQTFSYCELGVEGPHDEALNEWYSNLIGHCNKLRLKKLEHSVHLTYPKEAQSSITEEHTKFIMSRSKALRHSSQLYATDKHISGQHRTKDVYSSNPYSVPYSSPFVVDVSDRQTYLNREEATGEMNSDPPRTSDSLSDFQGMEDEEDSNRPKELLVLSSDDAKYNLVTGNGACLGQAKAFQEVSISEKEALAHLRDPMRLENGGTEMDISKVKKMLPDKFQLLKNKSKGGLQDDTGNQRSDIRPWDGGPLSLPTGLYNTQQNIAGLKALNEQSDFISKLSSSGQTNLDKCFFPNHGTQEESADKPQLRHSNLGQKIVEKKARNCDQCKQGDIGTATAQCGHSFCRNCFSASEDTCTACLRSSPVGAQHAVRGTMTHAILSSSVMGYYQDPTLKIIYDIPDGVQGPGDPNPGSLFTGGRFEAFLPDNKEGRKLLTLLERGLARGLTFRILSHPSGDKLTWNILHKTSLQGGKSKNGYPDTQYIGNVFRQLKEYGIE